MTGSKTLRVAAASFAAATVVAPGIRAAGEPKNMPPFTRPVVHSVNSNLTGEAKNEAPFTAPVPASPIVVAGNGFDWADAAIGSAITLGLVIAGLGARVLLVPQTRVGRVQRS